MTSPVPDTTDAPALHAERLLYVATGGIQAMFVPMWLHWLRSRYPDLELRYVMTPAAMRFTTQTALSVAAGPAEGMIDRWPDQPESALHVELASWPDAVIVHPATMDFVSRLAHGAGESPAMLALQCTTAPIVISPGLPPNGHLNAAYRKNVLELSERDNLVVVPPTMGTSMSSGEEGIGTPAYLPTALAALAELRDWMTLTHG